MSRHSIDEVLPSAVLSILTGAPVVLSNQASAVPCDEDRRSFFTLRPPSVSSPRSSTFTFGSGAAAVSFSCLASICFCMPFVISAIATRDCLIAIFCLGMTV